VEGLFFVDFVGTQYIGNSMEINTKEEEEQPTQWRKPDLFDISECSYHVKNIPELQGKLLWDQFCQHHLMEEVLIH
jgi:hypothetical protein